MNKETNYFITITRKWFYAVIANALALVSQAQSIPPLDLYVYDPSQINPAFIGSTHRHVAHLYGSTYLGNRLQGSPQTYQIGYETFLPTLNSGVGIRMLDSRTGISSQRHISGLYSYQREVGTGKLLAGIGVSRRVEVTDFSAYQWVDPDDPFIGPARVERKGWFTDLGAAYQYKELTIGVGVQQIAINKIVYEYDMAATRPILRGYASYEIKFNEALQLQPSVMHAGSGGRSLTHLNAYLSILQTGLIGVSYQGTNSPLSKWRFHGGIKAFERVECLLQYVPKGRYVTARGDLLLRMTLGKKE